MAHRNKIIHCCVCPGVMQRKEEGFNQKPLAETDDDLDLPPHPGFQLPPGLIITFLVGNLDKPSFVTVTERGGISK